MTSDREEKTPPREQTGGGTTQVGQVIAGLERLTRRLPSTTRPRRPRPYRGGRGAPPREHIAALVAALGDTSHPLHAAAVDELVEIGAPAVPALCDALGPGQPWLTAYRAAEAAGRIGDGRVAGPLLHALQHPNSNVRWSAVRALTTVGDVRAIFELRRIAQNDQGRTSWGEPVAGAAQSALEQLGRRSVWGQSIELIKTAVTSVLMILALILAFSVVSTLRDELDRFGRYIPGQTQLPQFVLPTVAPTVALPTADSPLLQPTAIVTPATESSPSLAPTSGPGAIGAPGALTGTVRQDANVRPFPSTDNQPIGRVNQGDEIVFIARSSSGLWYLITLGERRGGDSQISNPDGSGSGWINSALVSQPTGDLPVQEPTSPFAPTSAPTVAPPPAPSPNP